MTDRKPIEARGVFGSSERESERSASWSDRDYATEVRRALLDGVNAPRRSFETDDTLRPAGQPRNAVFVVEKGWLYTARILADGQRQLLEVLLPGQIAGLGELGLERPLSALHALGETSVREIAWGRVRELLEGSTEFCENVAMQISRERLMLEERLASLGRRDSAQRLGHFLLEMHHRLQPPADQYSLPVNQQFLADLLGLSAVHVSRMLKELREAGLVDMTEHGVELLDPAELALKTDFDPAYLLLGSHRGDAD